MWTSLLVESKLSVSAPGTGTKKSLCAVGASIRIIAAIKVLFPEPVSPIIDTRLGYCLGGLFGTVAISLSSRG